jgi:Ca-activated chloride channel family protein
VITFDAPFVLALAPLVGGAMWFGAAWARRVRIGRAALWSPQAATQARQAGRGGPTALSFAAFLGTISLAGPRWGQETVVTETRGLNLVVAVDVSRSMLAEDTRPSRLGRALREARRLVQDLDGDRIGLVAFAGSSYILSPLSIDASALMLYLDTLDPEVSSEGGTALGPALQQGGELLRGTTDLADRVLVVFTDGEAHDSLPGILARARRLNSAGVHLILVAEGASGPARIPIRDEQHVVQGFQEDAQGKVIETKRRDDILGAVADAAQGAQVAADLPDQAGAVRDLIASYKRARASETHTERQRPRAWIPVFVAVVLLIGQALTRRTAALLSLALLVAAPRARAQDSTHLRSAAERAWDRGQARRARAAYLKELNAHRSNDTAWYNAGTAALVAGDRDTARATLARAATSLDPDVRFRALYNLGLVALRDAQADSVHRDAYLSDAAHAYREALLLRPNHAAAKWNLELAVRRKNGGGGTPPPSGGGGGATPPAGGTGGASGADSRRGAGGLSQGEADQILASIGREELRTRREQAGRVRRPVDPTVQDW